MEIIQRILLDKNLAFFPDKKVNEDEKNRAFLCAFLLNRFGIEITNPEFVDESVVLYFDDLLKLKVPASFYQSPQDTAHFTADELLLEQLVSYWLGYGTPIKRIELFRKALPSTYITGEEIHPRTYTIVGLEEATPVLKQIALDLASYKRPFGIEEEESFRFLVKEGYFPLEGDICCRDNIFPLLEDNPKLARRLDKKDLVKLSILSFGKIKHKIVHTIKNSKRGKKQLAIIQECYPYVRDCPLSKRQAKYINFLEKVLLGKKGKRTNADSPYKTFQRHMRKGHTILAARYLATQGSLFQRNLVYILSRATTEREVKEILSLIDDRNEAVLLQLYRTLLPQKIRAPRTFVYPAPFAHHSTGLLSYWDDFVSADLDVFKSRMEHAIGFDTFANRKAMDFVVRLYQERTLSFKNRKSWLSEEIRLKTILILEDKLRSHYEKTPRLGKIYVSDEFRKIAIPLSTRNSGKGLDVLPSGSRIPFSSPYVRTFCHWDGVRDIDASLVVVMPLDTPKKPFEATILNWRTYHSSPFGTDALCSGDDTSTHGTEYQDICIEGLRNRGYRYAIACINGYGSCFDVGTIVQGLQLKDRIDTEPWDPKNIEYQMNIVGPNRAFVGFAIDLETSEIIVINQHCAGGAVVSEDQVHLGLLFVPDEFLSFNMHTLLSLRGEVVESKEEADIVFDRDAEPCKEGQIVVRPYDVAALSKYASDPIE